jgi:uncharacterized membrane protein
MTPRKNLILTGLLGIGLSLFYYVNAPARVAVHFSISGRVDGWAGKEVFLLSMIFYVFVTGLFLAYPKILLNMPDSVINLPNKRYWLSPERRAATIDAIAEKLYELGTALNVLFLSLGFLSFQASWGKDVVFIINTINLSMAVYVVFWGWRFLKKFMKVE